VRVQESKRVGERDNVCTCVFVCVCVCVCVCVLQRESACTCMSLYVCLSACLIRKGVKEINRQTDRQRRLLKGNW
jgi:hypothetical protein